jgi:hypothetical protein
MCLQGSFKKKKTKMCALKVSEELSRLRSSIQIQIH